MSCSIVAMFGHVNYQQNDLLRKLGV